MPTPRRLAAIAASTAVIASGLITPALVTPATAVPLAEAGVDLISVGWLTHSARVLDIGLDHAS